MKKALLDYINNGKVKGSASIFQAVDLAEALYPQASIEEKQIQAMLIHSTHYLFQDKNSLIKEMAFKKYDWQKPRGGIAKLKFKGFANPIKPNLYNIKVVFKDGFLKSLEHHFAVTLPSDLVLGFNAVIKMDTLRKYVSVLDIELFTESTKEADNEAVDNEVI